MLIDKKREKMYERCRDEKRELDKKLNVLKAILMFPPAFLAISALVDTIMSIFGETAILMTGAGNYGYQVMGASISNLFIILGGVGLFLFCAFLTVFRTPLARKHIWTVYCTSILLFAILAIVFVNFDLAVFCTYSIVAIPLSLWNEKLVKKDEAMSTLDGYPHFNIALIKDTERPKEHFTEEQLEEMDEYDRIMLERDGRL